MIYFIVLLYTQHSSSQTPPPASFQTFFKELNQSDLYISRLVENNMHRLKERQLKYALETERKKQQQKTCGCFNYLAVKEPVR